MGVFRACVGDGGIATIKHVPTSDIIEALEGGPSFPYPFNYFEKCPISLK